MPPVLTGLLKSPDEREEKLRHFVKSRRAERTQWEDGRGGALRHRPVAEP